MTIKFPKDFIFGTAVASYQVEGGIYNNDWNKWETKRNSRCAEPCADACSHYELYQQDIDLMESLGIKAFRFSIEWSRVEPNNNNFDLDAINHYVDKTKLLIDKGILPIVTFHHFTTPQWIDSEGSWANSKIVFYFNRYVKTMMEHLPQDIKYFNTINEPGIFSFFGYFSTNKFPPGIADENIFINTSENIMEAHHAARETIKKNNKNALVGMTHALQEWEDDDSNNLKNYIKYHLEDKFLEASKDDDYIALQTYTIVRMPNNFVIKVMNSLLLNVRYLRRYILPRILQIFAGRNGRIDPDTRTTKMGYEYRPEAVSYNLKRIHDIYPEKDIFITENGIATDDDDERIEFVHTVLASINQYMTTNDKVIGYLYWSLLDNFEWDLGYTMNFGLVAVDRENMKRTPKRSAEWFGKISKSNQI